MIPVKVEKFEYLMLELKELLLVHSRYEMVMKLKELSWQRAQ
jgi:hypothetical protein